VNNLILDLNAVVGRENVLSQPDELLVYECDGLPQHKHRPRAVVFPSSTEETAGVMRVLAKAGVPFTPRGAGTGLSGGALALNEGVVVELARMRKILKLDTANRLAVVQPGVVNLQVSRAAAPFGLYYVPDPSSQPTCTIGGNIAESAGGIHCLKYGTTTDHVLGCRVVLAGGEIVDLGGAGTEFEGYDLLGTFIGSEGTFGIATEATLRLVQIPPAVRTLLAEFAEVSDASHAVSAIIAAGVMPAALEMMDHEIIRAIEASVFAAGLPPDAGAALLIELDGIEAGLDDETERVRSICLEYRATNCRRARDEPERKKLWAARKGAFGAIGRISPDSMIQDAVVPRSRLPEVLASAYQIASKYQLRIANVFHAGDGNLHPLICFDSRFPEEVRRVKEAGRELMEVCVRAGGTITGEHGVGLDKRELLPLVFSEDDMDAMLRVRAAFDPDGLCNPGKIIPVLRGCGEARAVLSEPGAVATGSARPDALPTGSFESEGGLLQTRGQAFNEPSDVPIWESLSSRGGKTAFDVDSATSKLAQIVGETNISRSPCPNVSASSLPSLSSFLLTVAPSSIAEISEVMRLASSEGWTILPAGAGTWLSAGHGLKGVDVILTTQRLNRIIEHEPADLIAVSEAGVTLTDFNKALTDNGQWLPLDPPDDGHATIGGVVATGLGGAQQYAYGRPRGSVIGMRVVLADGRVIKAGGRVVKNVAGYDLCKLFTGSYGRLGIIAEVNFKLRPRPVREATIVAPGEPTALISLAQAMLDARLFPVATELVSSRMANLLGLVAGEGSAALLVRFAGNEKGVEYQVKEALSHLGQDLGTKQTEVVIEDTVVWQKLAAVPLQANESFCWRASVLPAKVRKFFDAVRNIIGEDFSSCLWQIGVADGRLRLLSNLGDTRAETIVRVNKLRGAARLAGGMFIVEKTNEEIERQVDTWGETGPAKHLMDRIKSQLDPRGVFPDYQ
jgi:glycolate oxidase subunit GlcD